MPYPAGPLLLTLTKLKGVAFLDAGARPAERECVKRWKQEFSAPKAQVLAFPSAGDLDTQRSASHNKFGLGSATSTGAVA